MRHDFAPDTSQEPDGQSRAIMHCDVNPCGTEDPTIKAAGATIDIEGLLGFPSLRVWRWGDCPNGSGYDEIVSPTVPVQGEFWAPGRRYAMYEYVNFENRSRLVSGQRLVHMLYIHADRISGAIVLPASQDRREIGLAQASRPSKRRTDRQHEGTQRKM